MKKHLIAGLAAGLALAVVCTAARAEAPSKKFKIGMSQCNLGEPWRVQMNEDIRKAAASHPEMEVVFKDAQNDTLKQRAQIEEFVASGVNLLIVSPKEAAPLTAPIAEAYRKGIPVIVLDRRVLGTEYTSFIGADNKRIGEAAGRWIAKRLAGKGKVAELEGLMTSTPGQDRHSGFMKGIQGSGVNVVFQADMQWLEPNARKEMESALAVHPDLDLVYAHNDPGAHGAYLAAQAAGKKNLIFVGVDGLPQEGRTYVKQGILAASFEYPTGGKEAIDTAVRVLRGDKDIHKEVTLKSHFYTPENVDKGGEWVQ